MTLVNQNQVQFVLHMWSLEHGQIPYGYPLKDNWVFPHPHPHQKPPIVESYTAASLSQFLRVFLGQIFPDQLYTLPSFLTSFIDMHLSALAI